MTSASVFLGNLGNFSEPFHDITVVVPYMRRQTAGAVLEAVFVVGKGSSALISQRVKRTITKEAVKSVGVFCFVAGEGFAVFMAEK